MSVPTKGPTLEQMHKTWLRRKKPNWPDTFEQAMQHELYRRILMIESLHKELRTIAPIVKQPSVETSRARIGYWMDTDDDKDPLDGA